MSAPTSRFNGSVVAVCKKADPGLPKTVVDSIRLFENFGVEGDYHSGRFIRHRFLARKDPTRLNHRQVLLVDISIYADLVRKDIHLKPGTLGENILLEGIAVMSLPVGACLEIGNSLLEVSEVRNPCYQLNEIHPRLLKAVAYKVAGKVHRNAGVMARVLKGGWVQPGNPVVIQS